MKEGGVMNSDATPANPGPPGEPRLPVRELVIDLRSTLGAKLVAYLGSVRNTSTVGQWANGEAAPPVYVEDRLRCAHAVAGVIAQWNSPKLVQAWFMGENPALDDMSPARTLRYDSLTVAAPAVLAAARSFVATG